jgi:hypothetical protein
LKVGSDCHWSQDETIDSAFKPDPREEDASRNLGVIASNKAVEIVVVRGVDEILSQPSNHLSLGWTFGIRKGRNEQLSDFVGVAGAVRRIVHISCLRTISVLCNVRQV